jgi:hypothetical protein
MTEKERLRQETRAHIEEVRANMLKMTDAQLESVRAIHEQQWTFVAYLSTTGVAS